ncbi:ATP-binding protein [Kitasatospora sp. DSM 101779]|uniref:ATP-binding protein n=1 Tax=Kitasatospora sp. DSM 101779 TaxID=2853165 RepID=UPI0021DA6D06|nr:ATP-binding protein [Kitasatospora sp. DSM 101779]MCU7823193.1 ATP-binding protein [Kitasatospora sp. DSM 101779]
MTTHRRTFAGHPQELSAVRRWARTVLNDHPRADDAELVVSELSTNALQHTESGREAGRFEVTLTLAALRVAITVTDGGASSSTPNIQHPGADSTHGRGLDIVSALADRFVISGDYRGRAITAELSLPEQRQRMVSWGGPSLTQLGYLCEHRVRSEAGTEDVRVVNTLSAASADEAIRWVRRSITTLLLALDVEDRGRLGQWVEADHVKALDNLRRGLPCTIATSQTGHQWSAGPVLFLPLLPPTGKPVIAYQPTCSRVRRRNEVE